MSPGMRHLEGGGSLFFYDDAGFVSNDWTGLCDLGTGGKVGLPDADTKIGRHGLGFKSIFSWTDLPSVFSNDIIQFFDPLEEVPLRTLNKHL